MCRRYHLKEVKNCKVYIRGSVTAPQKVLVLDCRSLERKNMQSMQDNEDQMVETERRESKDTI